MDVDMMDNLELIEQEFDMPPDFAGDHPPPDWHASPSEISGFATVEALASRRREQVLTWAPEPDGKGDTIVNDAHEAAFAMFTRYVRREGGHAASIQLRSWKEGVRIVCNALSQMSVQGANGNVTLANVRLLRACEIKSTPNMGFNISAAQARACGGTYATHLVADILLAHYSDCEDGKTDVATHIIHDAVLCVVPVMLGSEEDVIDLLNPPTSTDPTLSPYAATNIDAYIQAGECPYDCGGYFIVNGVEKIFPLQESMMRDVFRALYKPVSGHTARMLVAEFKTAGQQRNKWRAAYPIASIVRIVSPEEHVEDNKHGFCLFFGHSIARPGSPGCVRVWDVMRALGIEDEQEMIELALLTVRGRDRIKRAKTLIRNVEGYGCQLSIRTPEQAAMEINNKVSSSTQNALDNILFSHVSISPMYRGLPMSVLRRIKAWHVGMLTSTYINAKISEKSSVDAAPRKGKPVQKDVGCGEDDSDAGSGDEAAVVEDGDVNDEDDRAVSGASFVADRDHMQNKRVIGIGDALIELIYACVKKYFMRGATRISRVAKSIDKMISYVNVTLSPLGNKNSCSAVTRAIMSAFRSGNWKPETGNISYRVAQTTLKSESNVARITHVRAYAPPTVNIGESPTGSSTERHSLHQSQIGWMCPANTPEDKGIGIKKNVCQTVTISTQRNRIGVICGCRGGDTIRPCDIPTRTRVRESIAGFSNPYLLPDESYTASADEGTAVHKPFCAIRLDDVHCCYICGNYVEIVDRLCMLYPYDCEIAFTNGWSRSAHDWIRDVQEVRRQYEQLNGNISADDPDEWMMHCDNPTISQYPVRLSMYSSRNVANYISQDIKVRSLYDIVNLSRTTRHFNAMSCTSVVVNGVIVGICDSETSTREFLQHMETLKATDLITAAVVHIREARSIVISTSGCRFVRPLLTVGHGDPSDPYRHFIECRVTENDSIATEFHPDILHKHGTTLLSLVNDMVVQFVDPAEENRIDVARTMRELVDNGAERGVEYTHCEVSTCAVHSITADAIPFAPSNQPPRNVFFCHMSQQAMGPQWLNPFIRDSVRTFNYEPDVEKPMVFTKSSMMFGLDDMPSGRNYIVAILPFGDNMEDNTIFNEYSRDRGLGRAYVTRTVISQCDDASETFYGGTSSDLHRGRGSSDLQRIRASCVNRLGEWVTSGDIVAYVYDVSDALKSTARRPKFSIQAPCDAYFAHAHFIDDDTRGVTLLVQRYIIPCIPNCGDKFEPRNAQKNTIGLLMCGAEMPWVAVDGMTPDIVMNPHALAARMTWNQIFEIAICLIAAHLGMRFDGSSFEYKIKRGKPQHLPSCSDETDDSEFKQQLEESASHIADPEECARRMKHIKKAYAKRWDALNDACCPLAPDKIARTRVDIIADALHVLGLPKTLRYVMYSGITGRRFDARVCIGMTHYQRLKHMSDKHVIARSRGPVDEQTLQPLRGASGGGIRFGEMEADKTTSHGAARLLAERMSSDVHLFPVCVNCGTFSIVAGGEDPSTSSYCKICGRRDTWAKTALPMSTVNLISQLCAVGIVSRLTFDSANVERLDIVDDDEETIASQNS